MKETIVINSKSEVHFIKQCEIIYFQSENYTTHFLKTNDQKITAAKPLSTFLKLLDKTFVRVNQSYLINSMHIVKTKIAKELLNKPVKIHSTAIDEIKQEMQDILTAADQEKTSPEREKPSALRKDTGGKDDV